MSAKKSLFLVNSTERGSVGAKYDFSVRFNWIGADFELKRVFFVLGPKGPVRRQEFFGVRFSMCFACHGSEMGSVAAKYDFSMRFNWIEANFERENASPHRLAFRLQWFHRFPSSPPPTSLSAFRLVLSVSQVGGVSPPGCPKREILLVPVHA